MPYTKDGIGHRRIDTSEDAAADAADGAPFYRLMVLQDLNMNGPSTADEVADRLNQSPLTIRPRVSELRTAGKIRDTGARRRNASGKSAAVWELVKISPSYDGV